MMTRVTRLTQTRLQDEATQGNCWEACIHGLLGDDAIELDLRDTHAGMEWEGHWFTATSEYLAGRGFAVVLCHVANFYLRSPSAVYIACGPSPRGAFEHAVLYCNGALWHDPHPSGAGLVSVTGYGFLISEGGCQPAA